MTDRSPAFPCSNEQYTHGNPQTGDAWSGMSLRDWFAGQALVGMISNGATVTVTDKAKTAEMILASAAYTLAAAMLEARAA